jgi:hypothetical protein
MKLKNKTGRQGKSLAPLAKNHGAGASQPMSRRIAHKGGCDGDEA